MPLRAANGTGLSWPTSPNFDNPGARPEIDALCQSEDGWMTSRAPARSGAEAKVKRDLPRQISGDSDAAVVVLLLVVPVSEGSLGRALC
jgi:hypothetical protein